MKTHVPTIVLFAAMVLLASLASAQIPYGEPQTYQLPGDPGQGMAVGQGQYLTQPTYTAPQAQYPMAQPPYAVPQAQYAPYQGQYAGIDPAYVAAQPPCAVPQGQGAMPQGVCAGPQCPYVEQYAPAGFTSDLYDPGAGCRSSCWTFRADELFLQRSTSRNQALIRDYDTDVVLLNSQTGLNFPVEIGFQVSAIRQILCGLDIEVGYFQLDGWNANAWLSGSSMSMVTDLQTGYFNVSDVLVLYTSAIYLGELNLRHEVNNWLTLLAGLRMGELNERYRAIGTEALMPISATLTSNTFNHLWGFQIGADAEAFNNGMLRINTMCKAGIYDNAASQTTRRFDPVFVNDTQSATRNHAAFLGEAGIVATYQITEHLSARAVYQAVWLEGVALAPEQIGATNFTSGATTVDTAGGLFYHGGGGGLELRF